MHEENKKYAYDGPVTMFNVLVADRWMGETMAPNERKAKSNLTYQVKKQLNLLASSKVSLIGDVKEIN